VFGGRGWDLMERKGGGDDVLGYSCTSLEAEYLDCSFLSIHDSISTLYDFDTDYQRLVETSKY